MDPIIWGAIFALVILVAVVATRRGRVSRGGESDDTGLALLQFGRAFPHEAVRQLISTANGKAVFLRLHDNKAGFIRKRGTHFACQVVDPEAVRVTAVGDHSLAIEFERVPHHNGAYVFATPAEAAEVSLWLLGNYLTQIELDETDSPP